MPRSPPRLPGGAPAPADVLFASYFQTYADTETKSAAFDAHFPSLQAAAQAQSLQDPGRSVSEAIHRIHEAMTSLRTETSCIICLEPIGRAEPTWQCDGGCHAILHLGCAQAWARSSLADDKRRRLAARLNGHGPPMTEREIERAARWECPKCRKEGTEVPLEYRCFCGKERDPAFDPWSEAPHACAALCGKPLGCRGHGHDCVLLCHPGPCPPCPRVTTVSCGCARQRLTVRCAARVEGVEMSCGATCGRTLPTCGHPCTAPCHGGACPPCGKVAQATCACGLTSALTPCSELPLRCTAVCGKPLPCGKHSCTNVCCAGGGGSCRGCPGTAPRVCSCGKSTFTPISCDDVGTVCCVQTCEKPLRCGVHLCPDKCHVGDCGECRAPVTKVCSCGKTVKQVLCKDEVRCQSRCAKMRSCGLHACGRRCCDGDCPPCSETCGRKLKCGNHKCPAPCHVGQCLPCPITLPVNCACGQTDYLINCGAERRAPPPKCKALCPLPTLCRHEALLMKFQGPLPLLSVKVSELKRMEHKCHFGACPKNACSNPCLTLLDCGHVCSSAVCHDGPPDESRPSVPGPVPPKVPAPGQFPPVGPAPKSKRAEKAGERAAAEPPDVPAIKALKTLSASFPNGVLYPVLRVCPPCVVPVPQTCLGGHAERMSTCAEAAAHPTWTCSKPCGRPLACTRHTCGRGCGECIAPGGCGECSAPCAIPRPEFCSHACSIRKCHPLDCPPCRVVSRVACLCLKTTKELTCTELQAVRRSREQGDTPSVLLCDKICSRQLAGCPHLCPRGCHEGPCVDEGAACAQEVSVRCSCKRARKEKWACARVRTVLRERNGGGDGAYDSVPRLLACDGGCELDARAREAELKAKEAARLAAEGEQAQAAAEAAAEARELLEEMLRERAKASAAATTAAAPRPVRGLAALLNMEASDRPASRKAPPSAAAPRPGTAPPAAAAAPISLPPALLQQQKRSAAKSKGRVPGTPGEVRGVSAFFSALQDKYIELGKLPWESVEAGALAEARMIRTAKPGASVLVGGGAVRGGKRETMTVSKRMIDERQAQWRRRWRTVSVLYTMLVSIFVSLLASRVAKFIK